MSGAARPRIAVVTWWDARKAGSGVRGMAHYMGRALERHAGDVTFVGPITTTGDLWSRVRNRVSRAMGWRIRPNMHAVELAQAHARIIQRRLPSDVDVVFAPLGSTQIAFLETAAPIIYLTDATFELVRDYYHDFTGLSEEYQATAQELELRATQKARLLLYPSAWAAESALRSYGAPPDRVHVIPYGASIESAPPAEAIVPAKSLDRCSLVFLGGDWERKGGPLAYQAVLALRRRGIDAVLSVCGCNPAGSYDPAALRVVPRIEKSTEKGRAAMTALLLSANFLLQPARQEMFGIAYCEASAHGTPSIGTDTGGVSSAVTNGENGFLLPPEAEAEAYADLIAKIFGDRARYMALVASSRQAFDTKLNWDTWGKKLGELIRQIA